MTFKSIKTTIEKIENNQQISFWRVIFFIYVASFLRGFLENYANANNQNHIMGIIDTFFHYPFWFLGVFISVFILLKLFTQEKIEKISRLGMMFSWIIILAPILDLIIYKGTQVRYVFIVGSFPELVKSFFTFFSDIAGKTLGATTGMKIEILLAVLLVGFYVFSKTKKISRTLICSLFFYTIIFAFISLPAYIFWAKNLTAGNPQQIAYQTINDFYYKQEPTSALTNNRTFILDSKNVALFQTKNINNQYSITLSIAILIIDIFLLGWWFWLYSTKKFIAIIKNFRFLRISHYFLMALLGIYLGIKFADRNPIGSLFDFLSFASLFLCLIYAWLFSVWENDETDVEIDQISNPDRPLVKKELTSEEWRNIKYLFIFLALNFAFLGGLYLLIFSLLFLIIYHIYSAPPLRLKRFFGISSLLIACNALIAVLMGFFMTAGTENLRTFPIKYLFSILIIFFLAEHVKNLKDIEGDQKNGIQTLPVLLGSKKGKILTGIFVFFAVMLTPIIFCLHTITLFTAIFFGVILFFIINAKIFKEKCVFIVYFIFVVVFISETVMFPPECKTKIQTATAEWQQLYK